MQFETAFSPFHTAADEPGEVTFAPSLPGDTMVCHVQRQDLVFPRRRAR
jgi:hypothetical protein